MTTNVQPDGTPESVQEDSENVSRPPSPDDRTRFILSLIVAFAVITLALVVVVQPAAEPVLDKLLPLLTLVLGYFFGQQT